MLTDFAFCQYSGGYFTISSATAEIAAALFALDICVIPDVGSARVLTKFCSGKDEGESNCTLPPVISATWDLIESTPYTLSPCARTALNPSSGTNLSQVGH